MEKNKKRKKHVTLGNSKVFYQYSEGWRGKHHKKRAAQTDKSLNKTTTKAFSTALNKTAICAGLLTSK